jgi:hypothetical protein
MNGILRLAFKLSSISARKSGVMNPADVLAGHVRPARAALLIERQAGNEAQSVKGPGAVQIGDQRHDGFVPNGSWCRCAARAQHARITPS